MNIDPEIRQGVINSLPEAKEIKKDTFIGSLRSGTDIEDLDYKELLEYPKLKEKDLIALKNTFSDVLENELYLHGKKDANKFFSPGCH